MTIFKPYLHFSICALAVGLLITACGGNTGTAPGPLLTTSGTSGFAIDGYLSGATVLCDSNSNGVADIGEITATTDVTGFYKFSKECTAPLVATGGKSIDTQLDFAGKLQAPAGSTAITPLTTLVANGVSMDEVNKALDLPTGTDLLNTDAAATKNDSYVNADLFKKTLAVQQQLMQIAGLFAHLAGDTSVMPALYSEVAKAMAIELKKGTIINSGTTVDATVLSNIIAIAHGRVASSELFSTSLKNAVAAVNPDSLGQVTASSLKEQSEGLLRATDAGLVGQVKLAQSDTSINDFVNSNKISLKDTQPSNTPSVAVNLTQTFPSCQSAPPPNPGPKARWNNVLKTKLTTAMGSARHRGRDLFLLPGDDQWVLAKFAYGIIDKNLEGEDVDLYLLRECGQTWTYLGRGTTSKGVSNAPIEGVKDRGGQIFFKIPKEALLGVGRHRIHMVVRGDLSATDQFIQVVSKGSKIFVSDVDGTLTSSENVEYLKLIEGTLPDAHPDASKALSILAAKGVIPFYLTARPDWLGERTRQFLDARGFPPGIIHTTLSGVGAIGNAAANFKSDELADLARKGLAIQYAFGNKATDTDAYQRANVQPLNHRIFFKLDDKNGGRRINAYTELLPDFDKLSPYSQ